MDIMVTAVANIINNFCCRKASGPPLCEAEAICYEQALRWLENWCRMYSDNLESQRPPVEE
jgi:hypothetical protein